MMRIQIKSFFVHGEIHAMRNAKQIDEQSRGVLNNSTVQGINALRAALKLDQKGFASHSSLVP